MLNQEHNQMQIQKLQLLYRTNVCTKWMLKLISPSNDIVSIYVTRPVNETAERFRSFIRSCRNLNHLLVHNEQSELY